VAAPLLQAAATIATTRADRVQVAADDAGVAMRGVPNQLQRLVSSRRVLRCDRYKDVVNRAGICLCHIANGDIGKLLPAPLNFTQLFAIPRACSNNVRLRAFSHCNSK
jgi:hypothetical protein